MIAPLKASSPESTFSTCTRGLMDSGFTLGVPRNDETESAARENQDGVVRGHFDGCAQ
jgi:hypothetical protein